MPIPTELTKLEESLKSAKEAVENMGGTLQSTGFNTLADEIRSIGG